MLFKRQQAAYDREEVVSREEAVRFFAFCNTQTLPHRPPDRLQAQYPQSNVLFRFVSVRETWVVVFVVVVEVLSSLER